eukprot:7777669-Prorocentrum_lima.AAC.1
MAVFADKTTALVETTIVKTQVSRIMLPEPSFFFCSLDMDLVSWSVPVHGTGPTSRPGPGPGTEPGPGTCTWA